ncbi:MULTISPECIES: hypothetical protein [Arenibacter]|uniref:Uncharacterized protein n=1 Tax=Arenibacter echinorum TaxID=440515 RepID=A0A327R3H2_9FLAO|nr:MULTISPECIES: hypothetical protein [Arenibacter]MCK0191740.1 hypothetical protein [Arenibacter sp. F20364]RAJ10344.1 hypothetical protein LV92_03093 [Arenibacter echinorum]
MAATGNNYIDFVSELIYGDLGAGELGAVAPIGAKNHIHWTRDNIPSSGATAVTGDAFLEHHLDYMLSLYESWRSKYFLPPVRPWDGQSSMEGEQSATVPGAGPLPGNTDALGTSIRLYYNTNYRSLITEEMADEVKAPYSYRYWAFVKWASDLRKRVLGQPVIHVHKVFDRNGTILSEKDFTDIFHQVHHVWHPNGPIGGGWTTATPFFNTSVGQHQGKKEISRTQVGAEFFTFHRDHLELFDRWLKSTGQDVIQDINTCAHDTDPNDPPPAGVQSDYSGYPHIEDWSDNPPDVIFNDIHTTYWESDVDEFSNIGEMGQRFATDFNQFPTINVPGVSDTGYHGTGHVLNADLAPPVDNNHSPRFFAWHGFNDSVWRKREPRFETFKLVQSDNSDFPQPNTLTILRDLNASLDTVEPSLGVAAIDITNGQGAIRIELNVEPDPFGRTLELELKCEVFRGALGSTAVIALTRNLTIIPVGVPSGNQRLANIDFFEDFDFDGTAGTEDTDFDGPFKSDNLLFVPTPVGFKNHTIRISGYLTCTSKPDGTVPTVTGTISSAGLNVTGVGSAFSSDLRQGDLIRSNGQVRMITSISNNTSLILLEPFSPDLPAGSTYERLDGFDHKSEVEISLIQEKSAPDITTYLDLSTFSIEQVAAVGTTVFDDAFYVVLQDQTTRPYLITWPADVEPALYGLIAPPLYSAGLYTDLAHRPTIELRDAITDAVIPGVEVLVTSLQPEDPGLHPTFQQRVTCPCQVTFTGQDAFAGLIAAGDFTMVKVVVTATDRCGNQVVDDSIQIRLQFNPNPYMLDGPKHWLSTDTRVFQIPEGQARFGVPAGWTDPNTFIQQVISNFRTGNGTAGGETFDGLEADQGDAKLEYSTSIGGVNIYNFALAQVHLQSAVPLDDLRVTFRFFRWGVANVEFNNTLAYRSDASTIGLLGKTTSNELASIPFFAEPRVATTVDMGTQIDPFNLFDFAPTGGTEALSYFGAYLDINQTTPRFPQTYTGDGPFIGALQSIRDLLEDHHQCMVVELLHPSDPTINGSTPGNSDNLSQRNLLIVQTANPGSEITRTVQHAFNIDLTRSIKRPQKDLPPIIDPIHLHHSHSVDGHGLSVADTDNHENHDKGNILLNNSLSPIKINRARPIVDGNHHNGDLKSEVLHLEESWLAQSPGLLKRFKDKLHAKHEAMERWTFSIDKWKPTTGLDELAIFWNNLPKTSEVELYLPGVNVEEIFNFRSLRHAPSTVKIVDSHTLRLFPTGTTYLPIAPFWGDNISGLIKVKLPAGIKKGQRFKVDILQMRADEARTLGGFQLNIQVEKALEILDADLRILELFHKRLSVKKADDRWYPIVARQVEFARKRAKDMVALANEENPDMDPLEWKDPTEFKKGKKVRVVIEKIQITDDREPFFKGKGEFRFFAKVYTPNNGGILTKNIFPLKGHYHLSDIKGSNEIILNAAIFENWVEDKLRIQIGGVELDTFDPDDHLLNYKQEYDGNPVSWFKNYSPSGDPIDSMDMDGWKLWYRIEQAG